MSRIVIPADLAELFKNPDEIKRVFKFVRAMQQFAAWCEGNSAPVLESEENAVVDISDIVPRFKLTQQDVSTNGLFLQSRGTEGSEVWVDPLA
jgi:hypothetical protein